MRIKLKDLLKIMNFPSLYGGYGEIDVLIVDGEKYYNELSIRDRTDLMNYYVKSVDVTVNEDTSYPGPFYELELVSK